MALDPKYITDGPLEEAFLDKSSGLPLAAGTITFYRDSSRITPKPVYELTGAPPAYTYVALPNPITLSSVGTVQNAGGDNVIIYYYPWLASDPTVEDLYYVVVKDSNGVDQFTREAWPNGAVSGGDIIAESLPVQNQMSNPQFTQILINDVPSLTPSTTTYTVSGSPATFEVAPDWELFANGTGTVLIERIAISGSVEATTNPPYALSVTTGVGVSTCLLRQKFNTNSGLWTSTADTSVFLSGGIVVKNLVNVATTVGLFYQASSGNLNTNPLQIVDASVGQSADYAYYTGASVQVPLSDDSLSGDSGFIYIYIKFAAGSSVVVTSVQVVPAFNAQSAPLLPYDNASSNRAEALMGDYYLPRVTSSPIPSLLTAWDFPLNPTQFGATKTITTGTPAYVWDQLICDSAVGNVAVTRAAGDSSLQFAPVAPNDALYMIQYLDGAQAKELIYANLSSNIAAYLSTSAGVVTVRVQLFVGSSSSTIPTLPTTIGTINNLGVFSLTAANWSKVERSGLDTARAQISAAFPTQDTDIQFSGWVLDNTQISDTTNFAMVVTIAWTTAPVININSISLNKGDLPTRPAPQTASDVLSECQYYYEKSKNPGVPLTTAGVEGCILAQQFVFIDNTGPTGSFQGRSFGLPYKTNKRIAPTVTLYSVDGTINNVQTVRNNPGVGQTNLNAVSSKWTQSAAGLAGSYFLYSTSAVLVAAVPSGIVELYILFHYEADSRLGIV